MSNTNADGIVIQDYGQQVDDTESAAKRELLSRGYAEVMTRAEAQAKYTFVGFCAPWVEVVRESDNKRGTLEFTHSPRFYFNFVES